MTDWARSIFGQASRKGGALRRRAIDLMVDGGFVANLINLISRPGPKS